jgi:hypothetical protein
MIYFGDLECLMICTSYPILFVDHIKKTEMGGARRIYGRRGEVHTGFWWENLRERAHLEDPGLDERIILR